LNRGRHLYSAGRPSRWALAHILVNLKNWSPIGWCRWSLLMGWIFWDIAPRIFD